ncbi:hypothetical protein OKA05_10480 [Luteolibacter arcticus]|uniref:Apea-like HEPN domain-containing protein n=1 Tax=Luteolibacter arcticus TaxID=1581411 RepID=A0ABT3GHK2_9BACT|nr:hypothetical protein [Luteolibacter arcticus]MCW1922978.1 hypothetical protein [Luteolibacter arcticus]
MSDDFRPAVIEGMNALGFLRFRPELLVDAAVLGASFDVTIGGVTTVMDFPTSAPEGSDPHTILHPPTALKNHREAIRTVWGDVESSHTTQGILSASVEYASILVGRSEIEVIVAAHHDWLDRFGAMVRLLTKQGTLSVVLINRESKPQVKFFATEDPSYHVGPRMNVSLRVVGRDYGRAASITDIHKAAEWASSGKRVPISYLLLLSACDAFRRGEYRTAVIEATTALEVAITSKIRRHLLTHHADPQHAEWLLEGYDGLNRKGQVLSKVFGKGTLSIPSSYLSFRNKVAHGGHDAPMDKAKAHVEATWDMITCLIPDVADDP